MAVLRLHVDGRADMSPGAPLVASVLTEELEPVAEVSVPVGGSREVVVQPGSYLVRAVPPAGSALTARASVSAEEWLEVPLGHVSSPHEWLEWHALLGNVSASPSAEEAPALGSVWTRVWRREPDGTWALEPEAWTTDWDGEYATARIVGLEPAHRVLQLGGETVPWRLIALPTSRQVEILLRAAPGGPELDAGVDVSVVTGETRGEMLLHYLDSGNVERAHVVAEDILADPGAPELAEPTSAMILGYYLLRVGEVDRLPGPSLAERFPWLPDGWIIEGRRALLSSDVDRGRAHLLAAVSRGVPLYAEGMRLLSTGLRLLETGDPAGGDAEVGRAVAGVSELAAATNWTEPLTSFYGPDPASPTISPPTGVPEGPLNWMGPERGGPAPPRPRWPRRLLAIGVVAAVIAGAVWWATGGAGELAADPTSLSFGEQTIEAPSAAQAVTVSNDSEAAVAFRGSMVRGPAADDFTVTTDTCSGAELPDGRSCSLLVVFTPSAQGPREARLVLRHDAEGRPIRVALEGAGVTGDPEETVGPPSIAVDPTSITFPADVPEGDVTEELTISNDGDAVLEVTAIVDPEGEGFALDPESLERCTEIEAESSCSISISFVPARGTRGEANVVIESNATDDPLQVPLAGTPRAQADPTEVGTTRWESSQATVNLTNTGTRAFSPVFGLENERFAIGSHNCETLSIGGACSITLVFDGSDTSSSEEYQGALLIDDGSGAGPLIIPLTHPEPVD